MAKVSRRGLFKRAAVVAAAAPLGLVGVAQPEEQQPPNLPDAGSTPAAHAIPQSGYDRKLLLEMHRAGLVSTEAVVESYFDPKDRWYEANGGLWKERG